MGWQGAMTHRQYLAWQEWLAEDFRLQYGVTTPTEVDDVEKSEEQLDREMRQDQARTFRALGVPREQW